MKIDRPKCENCHFSKGHVGQILAVTRGCVGSTCRRVLGSVAVWVLATLALSACSVTEYDSVPSRGTDSAMSDTERDEAVRFCKDSWVSQSAALYGGVVQAEARFEVLFDSTGVTATRVGNQWLVRFPDNTSARDKVGGYECTWDGGSVTARPSPTA